MTEMQKLAVKLIENKIPFQVGIQGDFGTPQIFIPSIDDPICDIVCNKVSYGNKEGLLEIYSNDENDVRGWLTADQVFDLLTIK